jgi:hypothetical protein
MRRRVGGRKGEEEVSPTCAKAEQKSVLKRGVCVEEGGVNEANPQPLCTHTEFAPPTLTPPFPSI